MAILRSAFTGTEIPAAADIRSELSDLDTVCTRSSAAVAKQVEEFIEAQQQTLGGASMVEPDATVAATGNLSIIYPLFRNYTRVTRIKVKRADDLGYADTLTDMIVQMRDFLLSRSWTAV